MSYTLILNSSNVIGNNNTEYKYTFTNSFTVEEDSQISVSQVILPYSFFNINSTYYNNATFKYIWYYGNGLSNTYTVNLISGFYQVSDVNQFLELFMISQNQYFTNITTGQNLYFISMSTNITYYANQIICNVLPTSLPNGYSAPIAGFNYNNSVNYGYCNVGFSYTPRIIIPSYLNIYGFGSFIGLISGTYPTSLQTTSFNILSNIPPNASPVNSIIMTCNLVNNEINTNSTILDSFSINSTFGSNITYYPTFPKWIKINSGNYNSLTITLFDQNFRNIVAQDNNCLIALLFKQGANKTSISNIKIKKLFDNDDE
jgi:hypothetical protein